MTKIVEHSQGIYRIDWDVDREIVLAEPFFSYVVHDAVAAAGQSRSAAGSVAAVERVPARRVRHLRRVLGLGHTSPRLERHPDQRPDLVRARRHPGRAGIPTVRVAPRPGAIERLAGAVPTPHGLVRVEVEHGQVRVDSPVPVRFVSLSGDAVLRVRRTF